MSKFIIYHAITPNGYEVEIMTDGRGDVPTYDELAREEIRIIRMEKAGFHIKKAKEENPVAQASPQSSVQAKMEVVKYCPTCGRPTKYREGITKTGKPYKGYFCSEKGHEVMWVK